MKKVLLVMSIIVLIIQFLIAPLLMDLVMKWFYKANFKQQIPEYLGNFISDICSQHKMKNPKIGIITDCTSDLTKEMYEKIQAETKEIFLFQSCFLMQI